MLARELLRKAGLQESGANVPVERRLIAKREVRVFGDQWGIAWRIGQRMKPVKTMGQPGRSSAGPVNHVAQHLSTDELRLLFAARRMRRDVQPHLQHVADRDIA